MIRKVEEEKAIADKGTAKEEEIVEQALEKGKFEETHEKEERKEEKKGVFYQ